MFDNLVDCERWEEIKRANEQRCAGDHDSPLLRRWFRMRVAGNGSLSFRK